jgi:hypothetical protein
MVHKLLINWSQVLRVLFSSSAVLCNPKGSKCIASSNHPRHTCPEYLATKKISLNNLLKKIAQHIHKCVSQELRSHIWPIHICLLHCEKDVHFLFQSLIYLLSIHVWFLHCTISPETLLIRLGHFLSVSVRS